MMIRDKIATQGAHSLTNQELLSVVLLRGTKNQSVKEVTTNIIEYLANAASIPTVDELAEQQGISKIQASQILACLELCDRYLIGTNAKTIKKPEDVIKHLKFIQNEQQEHFVVISLNSANEVIKVNDVTIGLVNQTQVDAREVFIRAITDRAVSIILAHNHPSGNLTPSSEDINLTRKLIKASKIIDIPVIDHIIVSPKGFTAMGRSNASLFFELL